MNIEINHESKTPFYVQIASAIGKLIIDNKLTKGYKLPSERKLAKELGVHRNTIVKAYNELVSRGLVISSRKRPMGYFVHSYDDTMFSKRFFPLEKSIIYELGAPNKQFNSIYFESEDTKKISFAGIIMDKKIVPIEEGDKSLKRVFEDQFFDETLRLKKNILGLLSKKNILADLREIQIVAETNQALSCLVRMYLKPGDYVVAEEPLVPDIHIIFKNAAVNVVTVEMDMDGMNMAALKNAVIKCRPKFIYTLPDFHNPTGICMSLEKRQALIDLAYYYNIPIIEDAYLSHFNYSDSEIPTLYMLDKHKTVVYLDSFTLTVPYGLKVGYVLGPADLIDIMGRIISVEETLVSNVGQFVLNDYIDSGGYIKSINNMRIHYKGILDIICREIDKIQDKGISYTRPSGGLLLWCVLEDINPRLLHKKCYEDSLLYMPGWVFYPGGKKTENCLRLCFSNVDEAQIKAGIKILEKNLEEIRRK